MIIATAGHVDHGKTTLLQALTGVNADRLPEEKKRGMTIDLGYAYWPQPDGRILGFIDVPGHEKFLANMLAGVGGIDHALLVVACDDGIMAQTREHLAILRLTGLPTLAAVLTKADRVSDERLNEVRETVQWLLAAHGWPDAPLFVTAAVQGRGIDAVQEHLRQLTARPRPDHHRFRLAIDRAFTVKGAGLVVTGTALSGQIAVGQTLWLTGADVSVRVRGLHAQNQPGNAARAGQRIALNISGNVEKSAIKRGDWLLTDKPDEPATRVVVALDRDSDTSLSQWQPVHLHHAASRVTGRVSLLTETLAELVLDMPLWLADNDRLIVRDIAARCTLAGGRVVLLEPPRRGKRKPAFLAWLEQLRDAEDDAAVLALHLERGAVRLDAFAWARQRSDAGLRHLVAESNGVEAGGMLVSDGMARRWKTALHETLARYHQQHSDEPGPGRERLRRMALPAEPALLVLALIDDMRQSGALQSYQGWLHLPGHEAGFTGEQQRLWTAIVAQFGDEPWWVRDLAAQLGQEEQVMRQLLRCGAQQGAIVAIVKDRFYRYDRMVQFADVIRTLDQEKGATSTADFRDRLHVGRKLAIQILEYFDRTGFTRRKGNVHLLRDARLFSRRA